MKTLDDRHMNCKICGKSPDEHHEFQAEMPDGCVCDPGTWPFAERPPICDEHQGPPGKYCTRCEHDFRCHG